MSLTVAEFNKKYKLNGELASKFDFNKNEDKKQSSSIAGKPKKLGIEILKRFFTNPVVAISLLVFVIVLLMSILVPTASQFDPNKQISNQSFIENLPPESSPIVTKITDNNSQLHQTYTYLSNSQWAKPYLNKLGLAAIKQEYTEQGFIKYTYNAYQFIELYQLNTILNARQEAGQIINQEVVNNIWKSIQIHSILGTTSTGYDVWTRTWYATWRAVKIAFIVAFIQAIIGISLGAYLGFKAGKWIDSVVMRIIDIFNAAPTLIWILIFVTIFGATEWTLIFALSIVGWPGFVSVTRMYVITVKNEEYISAAKAIGAKTKRQVFVHALPAVIGKLTYSFVRTIPSIILWIASLAFLGFFQENNDINLGQLLITATNETGANVWILVLPAIVLLSISLSLSFIALGLHDALDPRVMSKRKRK